MWFIVYGFVDGVFWFVLESFGELGLLGVVLVVGEVIVDMGVGVDWIMLSFEIVLVRICGLMGW